MPPHKMILMIINGVTRTGILNIPWRSEAVEELVRAIVADAIQISARTLVVNKADCFAIFFI